MDNSKFFAGGVGFDLIMAILLRDRLKFESFTQNKANHACFAFGAVVGMCTVLAKAIDDANGVRGPNYTHVDFIIGLFFIMGTALFSLGCQAAAENIAENNCITFL